MRHAVAWLAALSLMTPAAGQRTTADKLREVQAAQDAREAEQGMKAAVARLVLIRAEFPGSPSIGAGLIVGRTPELVYVVTADHVVRRGAAAASRVTVALRHRPGLPREAQLLPQRDVELDLAVLAVPGVAVNELDLCADSFFALGDQDIARGMTVFPLGHPNGVRWFRPVTGDAVADVANGEVTFQSALLAPGQSGGALMSASGHLVGIVTSDAPPFGRAASALSVLQRLRDWDVPRMMHNVGHQNIIGAIQSQNIGRLREQLRVCDPNQAGAEAGRSYMIRRPMDYARKSGSQAMVEELLRAGAHP
ncbi:S1 family peptidase [Rubrivivax sp. RP6-9]|uniref:S1 family peptidase n=1 Tax=Rubrivivax sp. RP6-9 TaxID=3415750 RepID=UPI003CC669E8